MSEDKRTKAKRRADRLRSDYEARGEPLSWFEALYAEAKGDAELIPWGGVSSPDEMPSDAGNDWQHGRARLPLLNWLEALPSEQRGGKALDVGCGLGHNAVALHRAGFEVTGFDIAPTAVDWAAKLYVDYPINWAVENLLSLPLEWRGRFDLVSETFTIQALVGEERQRAFKALADLVAPKGRLLIVCRGRLDDEIASPPPWPLTPSELLRFETFGFRLVERRDYFDDREPPNRHFVAEFKRI